MLEGSRRGIIPLGLVLALRLDWLLHCNCRAAAHEGIIYLVPDHKQGEKHVDPIRSHRGLPLQGQHQVACQDSPGHSPPWHLETKD